MSPTGSILLVEDNPTDALMVENALRRGDEHWRPRRILAVDNMAAAADAIDQDRQWDAIIIDLGLPDSEGVDTVRRVRRACAAAPIIVVTGNNSLAKAAIMAGADAYLPKHTMQRLPNVIAMIVRDAIWRQERARALATAALRINEARFATDEAVQISKSITSRFRAMAAGALGAESGEARGAMA